MYTKVEGVDYSREGINALREELIALRDESMNYWPQAVQMTVVLSHTIAILAWVTEELLGTNPEGQSASG